MIPHLAEELWALGKKSGSIINEPWPKVDPSFMEKSEVIVVIQINGKRRAEINIAKDSSKEDVFDKIKNILSTTIRLKKSLIIGFGYNLKRINNGIKLFDKSSIKVKSANVLFPVLKTLVAPIFPLPIFLKSLLSNNLVRIRPNGMDPIK